MKPKTKVKRTLVRANIPMPLGRTPPPQGVTIPMPPGRQQPRSGPAPQRASRPSKPIEALHSSAKSGYTEQIRPGAADWGVPGRSVPVAAPSGRQAGRIPAAERRYGVAKYQATDLATALQNMNKRQTGKMPLIRGGIDDNRPEVVAAQAQQNVAAAMIKAASQDNFLEEGNQFGVESVAGDMDGFEPVPAQTPQPPRATRHSEPTYDELSAELDGSAPKPGAPVPSPYIKQAAPVAYAQTKEQAYMAQRQRVSLELSDSTVNLSCIDCIHSRYGVTLLLPLSQDGVTFMPKEGTELTLRIGDSAIPCYFPGTYFEVPDLKLCGMALIKRDA